jgi:PAS domain S-box-containing protein
LEPATTAPVEAAHARKAAAGWRGRWGLDAALLSLGGLCVAAWGLSLWLWLDTPREGLAQAAWQLRASTADLGWTRAAEHLAPADGALQAQAERARLQVQTHVKLLLATTPPSHPAWPALQTLQGLWAQLPPQPSVAQLDTLNQAAQALATAASEHHGPHHAALVRAWQVSTSLLATVLAAAVLLLWRHQRHQRRLRSSLQDFSDHLGSGDWQDAVQGLRDDRLGAPSAFDALASGVEDVMGESDRRWRALADLSADWFRETDAQGRLTWLSGAAPATQLLGWTTEEVLGKRRDELPFLDAPAQGWAQLHQAMAGRASFRDVAYRARARQGEHAIWVSISGRPRLDGRGEFAGYEGVGHNITERKVALERLSASEQRWSLMAGLASDWYWQSDTEHRLLPLSPELYRRMPNLAEKVVGKTRWEAHRSALSPEQWAEHQADLDAHRPFRSLQFEAEAGDGHYLWLSISGIPRFDGQGQFLGYHGVGRDITVRKEAERLLLRHNEALQRAVAERTRELQQLNLDLDAFSRQLAHELRTPISHVQGLAHMVAQRAGDRLTPEEHDLLGLQVQAARSMRDTVDALLLLARSTVQTMPMAPVDVSALALDVLQGLPHTDRRAPLQWHVTPDLHALASPAALRIVLANLLGNAAKFTRQVAHPLVLVYGRIDGEGRLRVCVQDNGAGFDPDQAQRLFQPFQRLHTGEDFSGTGIGLTIVQRIVERHGGTVLAVGEPGRGARFEFTLDAAPQPPVPEPRPAPVLAAAAPPQAPLQPDAATPPRTPTPAPLAPH